MEKQKIKIWAIAILATLVTVGAVATFVSKQRGLFKGFFPKSITTISDTQEVVKYLPEHPTVGIDPQITSKTISAPFSGTVASFIINNPTADVISLQKFELIKTASDQSKELAMNKLKNFLLFTPDNATELYKLNPTAFTTDDGKSGIRFDAPLITIGANQSKRISLAASVDSTAGSGKKFRFTLRENSIYATNSSSTDVDPISVPIYGIPGYPLDGQEFTIAYPPKFIVSAVESSTNKTVAQDSKGQIVLSLSMINNIGKNINIKQMNFYKAENLPDSLSPSKIKNLRLFKNGAQIPNAIAAQLESSPGSAYVKFGGSNTILFNLANGTETKLDLIADIDSTAEVGKKFFFGINLSAIIANDEQNATVAPDGPTTIYGHTFTIEEKSISSDIIQQLGQYDAFGYRERLTYTEIDGSTPTGQGGLFIVPVQEFQPATTVNAGAADQAFVQFRIINTSNQTANVSKIELIKTSTSTPELNNDKFSNFKLFKGTQMIASAPAIIVENNKNIIRWSSSTGTLVSQAIAPQETPIYTFKASIGSDAPGNSKFIFKIDTVGIQTTVPMILPPPGVVFMIPPEFTIATATEQPPGAGADAGTGAGTIDISGGALGDVVTPTTSTQTQSLAIESVFNAQQSVQINAGTANAVVAGFKFKNNTQQTVSISKIILIKTALSGQELSNDKISDIRLFKNGVQIAAANQLYVKFGGNFAVFMPATGSTELFSLIAGQEASIGIKAAINSSAITGSKFIFKLAEETITANAPITALPSGFPLFGPEITITGGAAPPAPVVQKNLAVSLANDTPASTTVKTNEWFTVAKLSFVADGNIEINGLKISAKENIGADALALSAIDKIQLCTSIGIAEPQCSADFVFDAAGTNALFIPSWKIEEPSLAQALLIKAKLKTEASGGKKLALGIKAATDILGLQNVNVTAALPMYGNTMTVETPPVATLTCTDGKIATNGSCACPAGTTEYAGGTTGTYYSPNACIPCTIAEITASGGYYCPQNLPQQPITTCADPTFTYDPTQNVCIPPTGTTLAYVAPEIKCADPTFTYDSTQNVCMPPAATTTAAPKCPDATYHYDAENNVCVPPTVILDETTPSTTEPTTTTTTTTVATGTQEFHPAAANLAGTQKLTKAPEKSETGPGVIPYLVAVAVANGIMWWRKKAKS